MFYRAKFHADKFDWGNGKAGKTVGKIRKAGKMAELQEWLEHNFGSGNASEDEIRDYVGKWPEFVLEQVGLDENGEPRKDRKFTVCFLMSAELEENVMAENSKEAVQKAYEELMHGSDPFICLSAHDVCDLKPVGCTDELGNHYCMKGVKIEEL